NKNGSSRRPRFSNSARAARGVQGGAESSTFLESWKKTADLLKFDDVNVIGLDWSHFTKSLLYTWVVSEVPNVGQFVGEMANYLVSLGLSTSNVHLVGHSLGAHVSGFAGKRMQESGFVPARVSGML
ncbi:unnamed protein product, partial [Nesidiocoris tenuis]